VPKRYRTFASAFLSDKLEPIEPLERLSDYPLYVDLTKRTLPGLAVMSGTLSGLRHAIRPSGVVSNGGDDLLAFSRIVSA
jgi:hypothetical protein